MTLIVCWHSHCEVSHALPGCGMEPLQCGPEWIALIEQYDDSIYTVPVSLGQIFKNISFVQVFIPEQVAYSKPDLERHMRTGDLTGPMAESGFKGHPQCRWLLMLPSCEHSAVFLQGRFIDLWVSRQSIPRN